MKPNFKQDIYEYAMAVDYEITSLAIKTQVPEEAYVSIEGESDLEIGENKILIQVIDKQNEERKTTYTVKVERKEEEKEKNDTIIISIVILLAILIVSIGMIKMRKKK